MRWRLSEPDLSGTQKMIKKNEPSPSSTTATRTPDDAAISTSASYAHTAAMTDEVSIASNSERKSGAAMTEDPENDLNCKKGNNESS